MKHSRKLKIVLVSLFAFLLSSCGTTRIKNSEWCGDLGDDGAACFKTLTDEKREISKDAWDKERVGMLCTTPDTFSNWQALILKLCQAPGNKCTYDVKKKVVKFFGRVNTFLVERYDFHTDIPLHNEEFMKLIDKDLKRKNR